MPPKKTTAASGSVPQTLPIGFALVGLKTDQFAIIPQLFTETEELDTGVTFHFSALPKERIVNAGMKLEFLQKNAPFLLVAITCQFEIAADSWPSLSSDNKTIVLPMGFVHHMGIVAVGTARGVLHAKTEGTPFNRFMLPFVNVHEAIPEDVVLHLTDPS